jgi:hypothetical protein
MRTLSAEWTAIECPSTIRRGERRRSSISCFAEYPRTQA